MRLRYLASLLCNPCFMYPYLLTIIAEGQLYYTRHKTYGEALVFKLELEARFGQRVRIILNVQEVLHELEW
ncbi:hypothetical protein GCM10028773_51810 [Spirosoma koreense]